MITWSVELKGFSNKEVALAFIYWYCEVVEKQLGNSFFLYSEDNSFPSSISISPNLRILEDKIEVRVKEQYKIPEPEYIEELD